LLGDNIELAAYALILFTYDHAPAGSGQVDGGRETA
jgi:hypothetical protein